MIDSPDNWFPQVMIFVLVATSISSLIDHGCYHIVLDPISQPYRPYSVASKPSSILSVQEKRGACSEHASLEPGAYKNDRLQTALSC